MPIRDIQQRMAEQGRIRLGQKVGGGRGRPEKLDRFRFTSGNRTHIESLATLYGGDAKPWDNNGRSEFEVVTDAKSVSVIVVKGGISQWMETWSGGGCTHRCDGYRNVLTDTACDPADKAHQDAKPTTRLSVMLSDLESLGVWRLESHGWNAAAELPSMAELAMFVGDYVPAILTLQERVSIRDGKTSRFVVPVLDLAVSKRRLVELVGGSGVDSSRQIEGSGAPSGARQISDGRPDYDAIIAAATSTDECTAIWRQAGELGHLEDSLKARITARAEAIQGAADSAAHDPAPSWGTHPGTTMYDTAPLSGPVDADVVEEPDSAADGDVDAVWQQLVVEAGANGLTDGELRQELEQTFAQPVEDLSAAQLREGLEIIRKAGA